MYKAKLSVQETTWSGFAAKTGGSISNPKEPYIVEVFPKQEIPLEFAGNKYILQITDIGENSVQIYTESLSVKKQGGGISLRPEPTQVTIQTKQAESFSTPTMDMGARWEVTLISIEKAD